MSNYPPERDSAAHSDDDADESERDGEAEEEEDDLSEEEVVELTELTPPEELAAMEDGPSTFFVGGFSTCQHLGDAIDCVRYKEDVVIVFPGVYTTARAPAATAAAPAGLELNEVLLGGLRIYSVPYARDGVDVNADAPPKYAAPSKRRVGPWFTCLTAAATATLLTQDGGTAGEDQDSTGRAAHSVNPLKAAASRAMAATDTHGSSSNGGSGAAAAATTTTTSGSNVFAPAITAVTANPALYPIFDFVISVTYQDGEESGSGGGGLLHYTPEPFDEDAEEEKEEDGEDGNDTMNNATNDDEDETGSGGDRAGKSALSPAAARRARAITLAGCCARAGIVLGALTRTTVTHCIIGSPQPHQQQSHDATAPAALRIAITAASLTEAVVEHCLVYGGSAYGLYAFPRAALTLQSCLVEGPNAEAAKACGGGGRGSAQSSCQSHHNGSNGGSVIEQLEQRRARAERLRVFLQRGEDAEGAVHGDGDGGGGSSYVDAEDGVLPRFVVPPSVSTCEVGIMCDDADVHIVDCLVSHTRLGVLLHGGCAGTKVRGLDIRSCSEAGLYVYGLGGAAEVINSTVGACGRACLLLIGPSSAEVAQAAAAAHDAAAGDDYDDDSGDGAHHPVYAQHPHVRANTFIGAVRVQGEVRSGALVDNFVFLPREEKSAAALATAAQTLLSVDSAAQRGFTFVGVEGDRVTGRVGDQTAAA